MLTWVRLEAHPLHIPPRIAKRLAFVQVGCEQLKYLRLRPLAVMVVEAQLRELI